MLNILPGQRLLLLLSVLLALFIGIGVANFFLTGDWSRWLATVSTFIILLLLFDAVVLWRKNQQLVIHIERQLPQHFMVNQAATVTLNIRHNSKKPVQLSLFDHFPDTFVLSNQAIIEMPQTLTLSTEQYADVSYAVKPIQRGKGVFTGAQVRLFSPWKLWQLERFVAQKNSVKTYPDFRQIDTDSLLSENSQQHGSQVHQRQRGSGTDFSQLREYRVGDALNQIDYKATARMNKLISKEFQIERDQQVMILLDCSRRLRVFQSELSHFDYALNTSIYLARTILNQGDAVGLMSFGSTDISYSKPRKGRHSVNRLLNQVYDLEPSREAPDYIQAAEQLMVRQKRRSLVILMTNLQEEDSEAVKTMLRILQKRHIVLIANLKEDLLGQDLTINQIDDAIYYASRETYHSYRDKMLQNIKNKQLILLDTFPQGLTAKLINTYLNLKQSGTF